MAFSSWRCQKCGDQNEGPTCLNCGEPKATGAAPHGVKFHIWAIVDLFLALFLIMVLSYSAPSFGEVFKQVGGDLPWLTQIICRLGTHLKPYGHGLAIATLFLGIYFLRSEYKEKVQLKHAVYLFLILFALLIVLITALFMPMFYLGNQASSR
jgi:hypothetical protein